MDRRSFVRSAAAVTLAPWVLRSTPAAAAETVLRIGMTASDIPLTTGQADNGGEGMRFIGLTIYDALVNWDLTS
ncbi:MAG: ABC transporter substrate-binding protein, partial [Alphaproteobacteria bacterium]|nr:ABC transporter substrate-binding protein [Alphaproteobacteria bacterium]